MTDMAMEFVQVQAAQQTQTAKQSSKTENSEGQSFSETLNSAINENNQTTEQTAEQKAEETTEEQAAENGAMLMVEALNILPMNLIIANTTTEQTNTAIEPLNGEMPLAAQPVMINPEQPNVITEVLSQTVTADPTMANGAFVKNDVPMMEVTITENAANGETEVNEEVNVLKGQSEFQKSIEMAHKLLKNDGLSARSRPLDIDIEELQKKVDTKEFLTPAQNAQTNQTSQPQQIETPVIRYEDIKSEEVFAQIKTAADANVNQGNNDFTIKLRPEGLGEITVKLVSQDGRITLSLSASDANVQKLLGSEINNLREVMRPYNVEVSQVVESNEASMADLQQQLQQQQSQQQSNGRQPQFAPAVSYSDGIEAEQEEQQAADPNALLDEYI